MHANPAYSGVCNFCKVLMVWRWRIWEARWGYRPRIVLVILNSKSVMKVYKKEVKWNRLTRFSWMLRRRPSIRNTVSRIWSLFPWFLWRVNDEIHLREETTHTIGCCLPYKQSTSFSVHHEHGWRPSHLEIWASVMTRDRNVLAEMRKFAPAYLDFRSRQASHYKTHINSSSSQFSWIVLTACAVRFLGRAE